MDFFVNQLLFVTGGNDERSPDELGTEIYSFVEQNWRISNSLPARNLRPVVININNRILLFGNVISIKSNQHLFHRFLVGGLTFVGQTSTETDNILEFDIDNEEWKDIGKLKDARHQHAVSIVGFNDYKSWCT